MKITLEARVDEKDALRYLGHRGQALGNDLEVTFNRVVAKVNALQAAGVAKRFSVTGIRCDGVELAEASLVLPGSHISRHVTGSEAVVLLAVTLGFDCERLLRQTACVSAVEGMMADACASSMVENAADVFSEAIAAEAALQGYRCGKRFSPGYGDFPLSVQKDFLAAIGAQKTLGIQVTPGDLMVPTKSITAVIPLFLEAKADETSAQGICLTGEKI